MADVKESGVYGWKTIRVRVTAAQPLPQVLRWVLGKPCLFNQNGQIWSVFFKSSKFGQMLGEFGGGPGVTQQEAPPPI